MKIYIENVGCERRGLEAAKLANILANHKQHTVVSNPGSSDIIIIYTCALAETQENYCVNRIRELKKINERIVIGGCLAAINEALAKELSQEYFSPASTRVLNKTLNIKYDDTMPIGRFLPNDHNLKFYKYRNVWLVKISSGCKGNCSFCKIKKAIGRFRSFAPQLIIENIREGIKCGFKKFQIESEDSGAFGLDINLNLPALIEKILEVDKDIEISLIKDLSPKWLIKDFRGYINILESKRIKYLLSPIQSGSQNILNLMRRKHDIKSAVEKLKEVSKKVTLWTQVMVGYPTETEEDFAATVTALKMINPGIIDVFLYKENKNTRSYDQYPKVDVRVAEKRKEYIEKIFRNKIGSYDLYTP
ncbi:MAG: radical SAM protein [Candidatus Aminicenantes bacterium]